MDAIGERTPRRGRFIVFEGIDGSGKSTQLELLADWLDQYVPVLRTHQPGATELGKQIRKWLLDPSSIISPVAELLLYAADRAQHIDQLIKPALAEGQWVLCDRWIDSTVAYQGYGRGLNLEHIELFNKVICQGLTPDLTLWLKVSDQNRRARLDRRHGKDRIEMESYAFYKQVLAGYQSLMDLDEPHRFAVSADDDIDGVALAIRLLVLNELQFEPMRYNVNRLSEPGPAQRA